MCLNSNGLIDYIQLRFLNDDSLCVIVSSLVLDIKSGYIDLNGFDSCVVKFVKSILGTLISVVVVEVVVSIVWVWFWRIIGCLTSVTWVVIVSLTVRLLTFLGLITSIVWISVIVTVWLKVWTLGLLISMVVVWVTVSLDVVITGLTSILVSLICTFYSVITIGLSTSMVLVSMIKLDWLAIEGVIFSMILVSLVCTVRLLLVIQLMGWMISATLISFVSIV